MEFVGSPLFGLPGTSVTFTDQSTGDGPLETWFWTFGDSSSGSTDQNPVHVFSEVGLHTVTLSGSVSGEVGVTAKVDYIDIFATPVAAFTGLPLSGPPGVSITFTNTSTAQTYFWDFGDGSSGSVEESPVYTYAALGTYTVSLSGMTSGAIDIETKSNYIHVVNAPDVDFSGTPTKLAVNRAVAFTDRSTGSPSAWAWTFGDGGTASTQNPSHIYTTVGAYTVSLSGSVYTETGVSTKSNYIRVDPDVDFVGTPLGGVPGTVVTFTDKATGASTWEWRFGDASSGSTLQNPTHQYSAIGTYTVSLSGTTSGFVGVKIRSAYVIIASTPTAAASANQTSVLTGTTVEFTDTSTNDPTTWLWTFGDGGTASTRNPTHQYTTAGTYTVTMVSSNAGGSGTATLTITVLPSHNFTNSLKYRAIYPAGTWDTTLGSYVKTVYGNIDKNSS